MRIRRMGSHRFEQIVEDRYGTLEIAAWIVHGLRGEGAPCTVKEDIRTPRCQEGGDLRGRKAKCHGLGGSVDHAGVPVRLRTDREHRVTSRNSLDSESFSDESGSTGNEDSLHERRGFSARKV